MVGPVALSIFVPSCERSAPVVSDLPGALQPSFESKSSQREHCNEPRSNMKVLLCGNIADQLLEL